MEYHILSHYDPKTLTKALKEWSKLDWKAQGGLVYGLVGDVQAYSILLVRTPTRAGKKHFKPPTLQEVKNYIAEKKYTVDPDKWILFYMSKNWMIGKVKMVDWKSAIGTWQHNNKDDKKPLNIPKAFNLKQLDNESNKPNKAKLNEILKGINR